MASPPEDLVITQIAPSPSMKTGRTSANNRNLVADYQDGVAMSRDALDKQSFSNPSKPISSNPY